ncbi:AlpA family transcriptional regulator [Escherichia coli]|uniref:helix-turn-helix transcriptional regulator n=1 Tax=Escherichia coli TaxID=562 RepID=UPI00038FF9D6|nr:AlpA family transcriptional regulator [Escherichia coli]EAC1471470.1 AlpA family transcriptional regulator [Escherichia coli]EEV3512249.1 AlpA family transcriptional regulator [Escherichia coli]EEX2532401.1 AlpA family transcriptional regulator [Escherichia coli]EEX9443353.1 AlpA family transcriptional regulator [Escherichia coli]EEZ5238086.1 AlpA family transcriptional regulator [Escherichia coli]
MHSTLSAHSSAPAAPVMPATMPVQERFMRLPEVIHVCGLSRSTIYDLISRDAFPAQISLGGKNVAWLASEVSTWMNERIAARGQERAA